MIFLKVLEVNKQKYPTGFLQYIYETNKKFPIETKRNVYSDLAYNLPCVKNISLCRF